MTSLKLFIKGCNIFFFLVMSFTVTSFEGNALYELQDRLRKMAESPESPTRYSLPPEEKSSKAKKLSTRKRKAPPSEKKETEVNIPHAEPGKIKIDFLMILEVSEVNTF